jgi:amidase
MPISKPTPKRPWQEIAKEARDYRDKTIAQLSPSIPNAPSTLPKNVISIPAQILEPEEVRITSLLPEELLKLLFSGQLSAVEVTTAYLRRAALSQHLVRSFLHSSDISPSHRGPVKLRD